MNFALFRRRHLFPFAFACSVGAILNCSGGTESGPTFSAAGDTAVMDSIVGTWTAVLSDGRVYTLTLCEDDDAEATALSCETIHQVKGSGKGANETAQYPSGGCGGCDYDNSAYTKGTLVGSDLASVAIVAQFGLTGGDSDGSLALPYAARISGTGYGLPDVNGTVDPSGTLTVASFTYAVLASDAGAAVSTGDAAALLTTSDADVESDAQADAETNVDAAAVDAAFDASSATPAPSASASAAAAPSSSTDDVPGQQTLLNITFHRTGNAVCPTP